jgi:hypothetical protein
MKIYQIYPVEMTNIAAQVAIGQHIYVKSDKNVANIVDTGSHSTFKF